MALNDYQTVAEIVRQRLGNPDASQNARVLWVIPQALAQFARKIAASEKKRPLLLTDPATVTVTLGASGEADLSALITAGLLLEFIKYGQIYASADATYPLQPTSAQAAKAGRSAVHDCYLHYYLEGTTIYTVNTDSSTPLTGDLSFACPKVPTLAEIPAQLEDEFIDKVIELLTFSDAAEDGEH